jgi:methyl-accepting chemotaxis protein
MTRTLRSTLVVVTLACATLVPARASAQQTKMGPLPAEGLTSQEREMLSLASDFARRCSSALERWVASGEVTRQKLFSFLYYPVPKTDPPKFSTDWDLLSDRDVTPIQEGVLSRSAAIVYAVTVDRHGYLPTHNQRYSQPLTGNLGSDLVNNRTKRIFDDKTGLAAARNEAPFLIQRYLRDTGETMADLSVPIVVLGERWGSVRIGYRAVDDR